MLLDFKEQVTRLIRAHKRSQNLQNYVQDPFLPFKVYHSFHYKIKFTKKERYQERQNSKEWKIKQIEFALLSSRSLFWDKVVLFLASVRCSGATANWFTYVWLYITLGKQNPSWISSEQTIFSIKFSLFNKNPLKSCGAAWQDKVIWISVYLQSD